MSRDCPFCQGTGKIEDHIPEKRTLEQAEREFQACVNRTYPAWSAELTERWEELGQLRRAALSSSTK